jgi:hypothetical protein
MYPCSLVLTTSDEIGPILAQLEIRHDVHMCTLVVEDFLARLSVEECNFSRLVACKDHTGHIWERADSWLGTDRMKHRCRLFALYRYDKEKVFNMLLRK